MGRDTKHITIDATVSRHNNQQDRDDDEALENLRMEIESLIAADPNYSRVVWGVSGP